MLLRCGQLRSFFHLGEEGGAQHVKSTDGSQGSRNQGHQRREQDAVVGLRILVAHERHRQRARITPCRSHIVLKKQMVLQPTPAGARRHRAACGFLRACLLCRRELSPDKDVYMYRGDQRFCSEECRRQQILRDEAREREAVTMKQRRGVSIQHHHGPTLAAAPRRLLAVG